MGRYHCSSHNIDYNNTCPECRAEQAETDRQSMIDALSELAENRSGDIDDLRSEIQDLAHKQANPGDYTCPECKFVTLKYEATRCPKCHCAIPLENWSAIRAEIKAKAEAAEQRKREAAEKQARDRAYQEAVRKKEQEAERVRQENSDELANIVAIATIVVGVVSLVAIAVVGLILKIVSWIGSWF